MRHNAMRGPGEIATSIVLAILSSAQVLAQQEVDLNNDGVNDTVRREIRLHQTDPVIGRVVLVSGADGTGFLSIPTKTPNDLFGWFVSPIGDLDDDGFEDLAVTAPASLISEAIGPTEPGGPMPAWRGRIDLISGATGAELITIFNPEATSHCIFGLAAAVVSDQNADGMLDIFVGGLRVVPAATPENPSNTTGELRWWVMSAATGEPIRMGIGPVGAAGCQFLHPGPPQETIEQYWTMSEMAGTREILPGIAGDMDGDGDVDSGDAAALIGEWTGGTPGAARLGDLNGDGSVNGADLTILLSQVGLPPDLVEAFGGEGEITANQVSPDLKNFGGNPGGPLPCMYEPGGCTWDYWNWGFGPPDPGGGGCTICPGENDTPNCPWCESCSWCGPPTFSGCESQCECYPCTLGCDEDDDGIPNVCDGFGCTAPSPTAQLTNSSIGDFVLLPAEKISASVTFFTGCATELWVSVENSQTAAVSNVVHNAPPVWASSVHIATRAAEANPFHGASTIWIKGLKPGQTSLKVRANGASGQVVGQATINVGGTIKVSFRRPLTFDGAPNTLPRPESEGGQAPDEVVLGGERGDIPETVVELIDSMGYCQPPAVRVEIHDALGRPKYGLPVRLVFRDGNVETTGIDYTDGGFAIFHPQVPQGRGGFLEPVVIENMAVLVGESALDYRDGMGDPITAWDVNPLRDTQRFVENVFTGHEVVYQSEFVITSGQSPDRFVAMMALPYPLVEKHLYEVLNHAMWGNCYSNVVFTDHSLDLVGGSGGDPIPTLVTDYERRPLLGLHETRVHEYIIRDAIELNATELFANSPIPIRLEFSDEPPPPGHYVLSSGALIAEIALSMVPGYDVVDVVRESVWKPLFTDDSTDWIVASVAFVALAADAGYLAGPAGAPLNFVAGAIKVFFKKVPASARKAMIREWDSVTEGIQALVTLAGRVPRPPGASHLEYAAHIAETLINRANRIMNAPLGLEGKHLARALKVLERRAAIDFSDAATEGLAFLAKHNREAIAESLFDQFDEEIIEATFDALRRLDLPSGEITDEAILGIAVATKAVGPNDPRVWELLEGTYMYRNNARSVKTLENLNALDGTDGLPEMVGFLHHWRNNADGIDGAIFEATAGKGIARGEVPGIGVLLRVSADGLPNANTVDTLTSQFAVQVKSKRDPAAQFVPSDLGTASLTPEEYLDRLVLQSSGFGLQPCLVTNRPLNATLQSMLQSRVIHWIQVAD